MFQTQNLCPGSKNVLTPGKNMFPQHMFPARLNWETFASRPLQGIARNCDWFISLFVPVVIGRSNCFGFGFSTVI